MAETAAAFTRYGSSLGSNIVYAGATEISQWIVATL